MLQQAETMKPYVQPHTHMIRIEQQSLMAGSEHLNVSSQEYGGTFNAKDNGWDDDDDASGRGSLWNE